MMSKNVLSVLGIAAANYGKDSTEAQAELWLEAFSDTDPELLKKAVMRHVKVSKWFPTVAELLGLIGEIEAEAYTGNDDHQRAGYWDAMDQLFQPKRSAAAVRIIQAEILQDNIPAKNKAYAEVHGWMTHLSLQPENINDEDWILWRKVRGVDADNVDSRLSDEVIAQVNAWRARMVELGLSRYHGNEYQRLINHRDGTQGWLTVDDMLTGPDFDDIPF